MHVQNLLREPTTESSESLGDWAKQVNDCEKATEVKTAPMTVVGNMDNPVPHGIEYVQFPFDLLEKPVEVHSTAPIKLFCVIRHLREERQSPLGGLDREQVRIVGVVTPTREHVLDPSQAWACFTHAPDEEESLDEHLLFRGGSLGLAKLLPHPAVEAILEVGGTPNSKASEQKQDGEDAALFVHKRMHRRPDGGEEHRGEQPPHGQPQQVVEAVVTATDSDDRPPLYGLDPDADRACAHARARQALLCRVLKRESPRFFSRPTHLLFLL